MNRKTNLPILRENCNRLVRCEVLFEHVAEEFAPPGLSRTDADQQHAGMRLRLARSVHTQTAEQRGSKRRRERVDQCTRDLRYGRPGIGHAEQRVEEELGNHSQFVDRRLAQQRSSDRAVYTGSGNVNRRRTNRTRMNAEHFLKT